MVPLHSRICLLGHIKSHLKVWRSHFCLLPKVLMSFVALNTKARIYLEDAASEPRFSSEARESAHRSIICLPIFSNRGQTFGAVYLASRYAFSPNTVTVLSLLCEQASIGISNALLFRSVQAGTRENLKMIAAQKDALEVARKSREDALKATKVRFASVLFSGRSKLSHRSKVTSWRP